MSGPNGINGEVALAHIRHGPYTTLHIKDSDCVGPIHGLGLYRIEDTRNVKPRPIG